MVLAPEQLFLRIPAGYASFLPEVVLLLWLLKATKRPGIAGGLLAGALGGLVFASAVALGLWSFTTTPVTALVLWWLTLLLQFTAAGGVLGAANTSQWSRARTWAIGGEGRARRGRGGPAEPRGPGRHRDPRPRRVDHSDPLPQSGHQLHPAQHLDVVRSHLEGHFWELVDAFVAAGQEKPSLPAVAALDAIPQASPRRIRSRGG
uniref:hypothetical protein n=1 Tax=Actinotalea sp. TaxID=1872145 RepID=UPI0035631D66